MILTGNASVCHPEKLLVATWIWEEIDVDIERTASLPGACAIQRKLNIDVTVPRERDVTARSHVTVVSSVAYGFEDQDLVLGTRNLEYAVETGVLLYDGRRKN